MSEVSLVLKGFKTMEQAKAFADWYEGAGEQDAGNWFEARKADGELDVDFMPVDVDKPYEETSDTLTVHLEMM